MKIREFGIMVGKKYGVQYSSAQYRKLEKTGLFKTVKTASHYRVYEDTYECVRPIILYFFDVPIQVIIKNDKEELKPYLVRIKQALKTVS